MLLRQCIFSDVYIEANVIQNTSIPGIICAVVLLIVLLLLIFLRKRILIAIALIKESSRYGVIYCIVLFFEILKYP